MNKAPGTILKNPRITEKASILVEGNAYTFDVMADATKKEIEQAVKTLYKVTPVRIRTLPIPKKTTMPRGGKRGNKGTSGGGKKAYVYLKKGDKIEVL